jgi:hypothetical protein
MDAVNLMVVALCCHQLIRDLGQWSPVGEQIAQLELALNQVEEISPKEAARLMDWAHRWKQVSLQVSGFYREAVAQSHGTFEVMALDACLWAILTGKRPRHNWQTGVVKRIYSDLYGAEPHMELVPKTKGRNE